MTFWKDEPLNVVVTDTYDFSKNADGDCILINRRDGSVINVSENDRLRAAQRAKEERADE